jgi:hypothetical protein
VWGKRGGRGRCLPFIQFLMRALSYILIALSVYLLGHAVYDEYRGSTTMPVSFVGPGGILLRRSNSRYLYSWPVQRENNPSLFHEFMVKHWIYAGLIGGLGLILCLANTPPKDVATPDTSASDPDSESAPPGG